MGKKKKKIKRTPEQKRMLWMKQMERRNQNIQLKKDLENQKKLERERFIKETKEKMEKENVEGMYYHLTTMEKADMIMDSELRSGHVSNVYNEKRLELTKGKIFFVDSDDERMWNGLVCHVLDDQLNEVKVNEYLHECSKQRLSKPENHPSNFSTKGEMMNKLGCQMALLEKDKHYNTEWVCLGIPKSYFIVNQLEKKDDDFQDVTNGLGNQIYFET